jgi:SAM-dependent methyltransferase
MEVVLPKRRFALLRRILRRCMPGFYGWMLGNETLRRAFSVIKGKQKVILGGDAAQRFTTIYETHYWVDDESRSGGGSNLYATEKIRNAIPCLFVKYGVRSVLDIPCGDFFWFKEMNLDLDSYIGGDIVVPLIASVAEKYTSHTRSFRVMDLTKDALPDCDLILVRDCFIHLSFDAIFAALRNILQSKIRYLLTTHYPDASANVDIDIGSIHAVNLCAPPFNFPPALEMIEDFAKGTTPRQLACGGSMTCVAPHGSAISPVCERPALKALSVAAVKNIVFVVTPMTS